MPRAITKRPKNKKETEDLTSPELSEDDVPVKKISLTKSDNNVSFYETESKSGGGECADDGKTDTDFGNDLRKMLDVIGTDVNKALLAKKQRLEQYSTGAIKANETKLKEMLKFQSEGRRHYHEEMVRNINSVVEQWNVDLSRGRDQEDKLMKIVQQQAKMIQQNRTSQLQRLAALRQLHETYHKNFLQQEAKENEQCNSVLQELRRELTELQKKMMIDSQKEEMAQMQKSFQKSVLFM